MLVCRRPRIESDILKLRQAIDELSSLDYDCYDSKQFIFKELVLSVVEQKMTFLRSENLLVDFAQWCNNNGYLQQAVTFTKESIIKKNVDRIINFEDFHILRVLRNSINHALGEAQFDNKYNLSDDFIIKIKDNVNHLLDDPNLIKNFVDSVLNTIRKKTQ
jgi:hypothetical protein